MKGHEGAVTPQEMVIDRRVLRRWHERWAGHHDRHAVLAERTRGELLERLDLLTLTPRRVLDAGAGTGLGAAALARRYPQARVVALDHAHGMCRRARRRRGWRHRFDVVRGDLAALPLPDSSVDLLFCNLGLQDCQPLDDVLAGIRRVLADGGVFTFATLGPGSMAELRTAWREVDAVPRVHPFVDMHDLGEALGRAGLRDPVLDVERVVFTYPDWPALVGELRRLGGASALRARPPGLTAPGRLAALERAYECHRRDGVLPLTCEVVFGHAWAVGAAPPPRDRGDGEIRVSVSRLGRRRGA
jgi:malonyl-CoA O-methyltransferase